LCNKPFAPCRDAGPRDARNLKDGEGRVDLERVGAESREIARHIGEEIDLIDDKHGGIPEHGGIL
jgi:hypothetical protein